MTMPSNTTVVVELQTIWSLNDQDGQPHRSRWTTPSIKMMISNQKAVAPASMPLRAMLVLGVGRCLEAGRVGFAGDTILDHLQRAGKFLAVHPQCVQEHLEAFPLALFAQGVGDTASFPPTRILCDPQSA